MQFNNNVYIGTECSIISKNGIKKLLKYWFSQDISNSGKIDLLYLMGLLNLYTPQNLLFINQKILNQIFN